MYFKNVLYNAYKDILLLKPYPVQGLCQDSQADIFSACFLFFMNTGIVFAINDLIMNKNGVYS